MNSQSIALPLPRIQVPAYEPKTVLMDVRPHVHRRESYLVHEVRIKVIALFQLLSITNVPSGILRIVSGLTSNDLSSTISGILTLAFGVVLVWSGLLLWRLERRGAMMASILSTLSLLVFPLGTVVGAYILWVFHSKKGRVVLSPEYQKVVELTPHLSSTRPAVIRVAAFLGFFGTLALIGLAAMLRA
ncbi:MAG: hypothetical protein HY791_36750 [Deltaproteobacteria bacterium]|nr:hypothetical protein [Deltaproteobacteria bacterium]